MPSVKINRLFRVLPWLLAAFLGLLFIALLNHELRRQEQAWQEQLRVGAATQHQLVAATRQSLTREALLVAHLIAQDQTVNDLIRSAYRANQIDSPASADQAHALREQLAAHISMYWNELRVADGRQLTVYLAPAAKVFYRAHHPQRYGDTVDGIRPLVMAAITAGKPQGAMEVGRYGSGYRAVVPIFADAEQHGDAIAALEIGFGLLGVQNPNAGNGQAVLINPDVVENLVWLRARTELQSQPGAPRGQWLLEDYRGEPVRGWIAAGLLPDPAATSDYDILTWEGRHYLRYLTRLRDFLGEQDHQRAPLAAILSWRDITAELRSAEALWRDTLTKWLLTLFITEAALLVLLRLSSQYVRSLVAEHRDHLEYERDISEKARQQLTLALASSESGFWEWDVLQNKAVFSEQWRKICGLEASQAALNDAEEWFTRVHPQDKAISQRNLFRHIKGEIDMYEDEYRVRAEDGSYRWVYARGKTVEWQADGKAVRVIGVFTDITARKEAEVTILRQQAALRAMNDIASLPAIEPQEQLRRALALGSSYLGLPVGIISHIQHDKYEVRVQVSPSNTFQDGAIFPLSHTYCSAVLAQGEVLAVDHIGTSPLAAHIGYPTYRAETYIGVPLVVSSITYGTLNFSSAAPRYHPFDELDKDFVRLLGRWMGVTIERWQQFAYQQELLQRFRKLSERLPGFLYQFQQTPDGALFFPYASAGIEDIYGIRPEQALLNAEAVFTVIHADDIAGLRESIRESAEQLCLWSMIYRINHPTRGLLWVRGEAKPEQLPDGSVLWHGFLSDVTHEKLADIELQATTALQQAILDAANVSIIASNMNGIIQVFNRGAEQMLGYTAEEVVGQFSPESLHLKDEVLSRTQELSREFGVAIEPGFDVFVANARRGLVEEREWTYVRKDGGHVPVLLTVSSMRDSDDAITGYLGIARDITESKRIEQMKNEFIGTVSHELRTPLTAVNGALGLLVSRAAGAIPEAMKKMLNIAYKNSERLIYLVNDLLDMEKLAAGKMHFDRRCQPILPIIEQAMETNSVYADQHHVTYALECEVRDACVQVDAQRLAQVMANLLSNAAKFSLPHNTVTVRVSGNDKQVRVCVIDDGIGIPEDFHPHIFQKFSQVDSSDARRKGGTGLGLAICKELIEQMGGSIGFASAPSQGSNFYFYLPRVAID